jgi:hypothetical protein
MDSGPPLCPQQEEMVAQRAMLWVLFTHLTSSLTALLCLFAYLFSSPNGWWSITNLWFTGISRCLLMTVKCNQSHLVFSPFLYQIYWSWLSFWLVLMWVYEISCNMVDVSCRGVMEFVLAALILASVWSCFPYHSFHISLHCWFQSVIGFSVTGTVSLTSWLVSCTFMI